METVLVEKKNINEVVELLKQDEVVAFPTETVFGLGVKFGNLSAHDRKGGQHLWAALHVAGIYDRCGRKNL